MDDQMLDKPPGLATRQRLAQVDELEDTVATLVGEKATTVTLYRAAVFGALILGVCAGIVLPV